MRKIFVVKLGWVLVGVEGDRRPNGTICIDDAHVVRKWGTTKGLGELALKGPRPETVLDACGSVEIQEGALLMRIKCSEENWKT